MINRLSALSKMSFREEAVKYFSRTSRSSGQSRSICSTVTVTVTVTLTYSAVQCLTIVWWYDKRERITSKVTAFVPISGNSRHSFCTVVIACHLYLEVISREKIFFVLIHLELMSFTYTVCLLTYNKHYWHIMVVALFLITSNRVRSAFLPSRFSKPFSASITAVRYACYCYCSFMP